MIDETAWAYLAGIVDGEGTIGLNKCKTQICRSLYVTVKSTTFELLKYLQDTFGGQVNSSGRPKPGYAMQKRWGIKNIKAINILEHIRPYIKLIEKVRRCDLILHNKELFITHYLSPDARKRRLELEVEFFKNSTYDIFNKSNS